MERKAKKGSMVRFVVVLCVVAGLTISSHGWAAEKKSLEGVTLNVIADFSSYTDVVAEQVPAFEKMTGARVVLIQIPFEEIRGKIMMELVGKTGSYDVILSPPEYWPEYIATGEILPINNYIDRDPGYDFEDIIPSGLRWQTKDKAYYGVPGMYNTEAMYVYRKDLYEEAGVTPPTTWEEFNRIAQIFTGYTTKAGERVPYGIAAPGERGDTITMGWLIRFWSMAGKGDMFGVSALWDENYRVKFNNKIGMDSVKLYVHQLINYGPPNPAGISWDEIMRLFMGGKAAHAGVFSDMIPPFEDPAKSKIAGKIGYDRYPAAPGKEPTGVMGTRSYGIAKFVKNPDASWQLIRFLTSKEMDLDGVMQGKTDPIRYSTFGNPRTIEKFPWLEKMGDIYALAQGEPVLPEWGEIKESGIGLALAQAASGELPAEEAMNRAAKTVEDIFRSAGYYK